MSIESSVDEEELNRLLKGRNFKARNYFEIKYEN